MEIGKDSFVVIEYTLRLSDGSYVRGEKASPASMNFVVGYGQLLPALEEALTGLEQGAKKEVTIPACEGFGERDESQVQTVSLSDFPAGKELVAGKWAIAKNSETGSQYSYFVREKTDSTITLDYNHPLVGQDLRYDFTVVLVRPALAEELEFLRPCEHGEKEN
ncbi:MAG: peptidylprolyl isomerase [Syntrophobacteraceae bacterium]|nr:peptidylprolyl isomerase [Syntrophobacteraceae bacterium]